MILKINLNKIALGGGCHWCTEAVFQSLKGVEKVEQGHVASTGINGAFSEAVIVHFNEEEINLRTLITIHLHTHKSTSEHSMRQKYRSAIYWFNKEQENQVLLALEKIQEDFDYQIITQVYQFKIFKPSREQITNYYYKNPEKPFCKTYIDPKLKILTNKFEVHLKKQALSP